MKNNFDIDKIAQYLNQFKNDLPKLYTWNAKVDKLAKLDIFTIKEINQLNKKTPFEKELILKKIIQKKLIEFHEKNNNKFNELALWIIKDWGGIKAGNDSSTLAHIDDFFHRDKPKFKRIASASKVGAFMYPEQNIIYDSRVAYSLNWILLSEKAGSQFFPIPEGRNSKMSAFDMNVLIRLKNTHIYKPKNLELLKPNYISNKDKDLYIAKSEAYFELICLIKEINKKLWTGEKAKILYYTEMLLFSIADKEIFKDITSRASIKIN